MRISIVTLNYNGSEETLELLKSLTEQTPQEVFPLTAIQKGGGLPTGQADTDFEIIVVDNASEEDDFANLQTQLIHSFPLTTSQVVYPQVEVVINSQNLGFSGGNNVGIRQALNPSTRSGQETGSDWVVLLNNDIWVEKSFIECLKAILSVKKGIIGIPLIEGDRVAYCGKIQWLKPTLNHVYSIKNQVLRENTNQLILNTKYLILNTKQYVIGGAMAVHKDVFKKIGFLDEKYFLYFEDADFSVRARKAGFDISVAENLNVHHHVSSSTKKLGSPLLLRYHYRNALYFNLKNGPWHIKLLVWLWSLIIAIKQLGKLLINRNREESKAILAGVFDFYKNRMGKIKP